MGGETVTEYRLRLRNGVVTPASLRPREGEMYYGRTAREQIEMMAKTERDYRNDPALVTIQVSRDGGESWETVEEAPAPDRSVDVLVAEAVERVHTAADRDGYPAFASAHLERVLRGAGFPALVEALAFYADGGIDCGDKALAALGGVRVDGRAELEAENERLREALRGYVDAAPHDAGGEMRRIEVERRVIRAARDLVYPPFGSAVDGETTTTTKGGE